METVPVSSIPVNKYRRGVRGVKPVTAPMCKPVSSERESKLKLDGDSRCLCSDQLPYGPLDRLAVFGIVPLTPKVIVK